MLLFPMFRSLIWMLQSSSDQMPVSYKMQRWCDRRTARLAANGNEFIYRFALHFPVIHRAGVLMIAFHIGLHKVGIVFDHFKIRVT